MSTKKIEGWAWPDTGEKYEGRTGFPIYNDRFSTALVKTTLVIGDERVFTESEVMAMVSEMVEGVTAGEELTLETIASKHGVSLNPA